MRIELRGRRRSSRSRCDGEPESRTGNGEAGRQTTAKRWWRGDAAAEARRGQGARRGLWRVDASLSLPSADCGLSATPAPVSSVVFLSRSQLRAEPAVFPAVLSFFFFCLFLLLCPLPSSVRRGGGGARRVMVSVDSWRHLSSSACAQRVRGMRLSTALVVYPSGCSWLVP